LAHANAKARQISRSSSLWSKARTSSVTPSEAAVAVDLALWRPHVIRSLTLCNPLLVGRSSNLPAWSTCVERAKAGDLEAARAAWLACPLFDGARDQVRAAMATYRGAHWTGAVRTAFRSPDPAPQLHTLTMPALIVTATRDQPSFQAMAREYHQTLPHSRLVELDASHMSPCQQPAQFNASLRSFLDEAMATANTRVP
jgi:pimeloyl-ACP methyl ester carboxylesterase